MLKQKIQADFVTAMKAKNDTAKAALSGLKAKITEAEKANGNKELDEAGIIKVISNAIKQRKQSYEEFTKGGRADLADKEFAELKVLEAYMPAQMSDAEIELAVREIMQDFAAVITNRQALIGKTIGAFNKKFAGLAEAGRVKTIIESIA